MEEERKKGRRRVAVVPVHPVRRVEVRACVCAMSNLMQNLCIYAKLRADCRSHRVALFRQSAG